jgi:hypothetical protein
MEKLRRVAIFEAGHDHPNISQIVSGAVRIGRGDPQRNAAVRRIDVEDVAAGRRQRRVSHAGTDITDRAFTVVADDILAGRIMAFEVMKHHGAHAPIGR